MCQIPGILCFFIKKKKKHLENSDTSGWNFVHKKSGHTDTQTDTQTNCSENITPPRFRGEVTKNKKQKQKQTQQEAFGERRHLHVFDLCKWDRDLLTRSRTLRLFNIKSSC